jgi:ABC-type multidrug transport system fused ATPase/permease subunit
VDVREWDLNELRRRIGVVLQDVFLFSETVLYNLRAGREEISASTAIHAAKTVNADRFVKHLRGGYDEVLRERGGNLSAGERQLLSFARALAHEPTIFVLDEATSSVDTETELLIQDAVGTLMQARTAVVVAHRLSTIEHVDRIIVMSGGAVRESGTHTELLHNQGLYYRLHRLQYGNPLSQVSAAAPVFVE